MAPPMKAAVQRRYGPPEVVLISEVEKPATRDNDVLVKVEATTVNRTDCACRAARPFFMRLFTGLFRMSWSTAQPALSAQRRSSC